MHDKDSPVISVEKLCIEEEGDDQRIDNFLFKRYKNVPKSHIYQLLRSGQIRVNGKRVGASYRLQLNDMYKASSCKPCNSMSEH